MARIPISEQDGARFRDLNGNSRLDPFEDPRRTPEERADDLLRRLSLEEKVGLLVHPILGVGASDDMDAPARPSRFTPRQAVVGQRMNHFNVHALPDVPDMVRWHNAMQELAEATPHGIPVTFSSDPRHGFLENAGVSWSAGSVSQWPEPIGLAAIGDVEAVRRFADVQRREYVALGLRCALHPQADLATEPRWARQAQTFGQSSTAAVELTVAYLEGMQLDAELGPDAVACTTKHFPGRAGEPCAAAISAGRSSPRIHAIRRRRRCGSGGGARAKTFDGRSQPGSFPCRVHQIASRSRVACHHRYCAERAAGHRSDGGSDGGARGTGHDR